MKAFLLISIFFISTNVLALQKTVCITANDHVKLELDLRRKIKSISVSEANQWKRVSGEKIFKSEILMDSKEVLSRLTKITCPVYNNVKNGGGVKYPGFFKSFVTQKMRVKLKFLSPFKTLSGRHKIFSLKTDVTCEFSDSIEHMTCEEGCPNNCIEQ